MSLGPACVACVAAVPSLQTAKDIMLQNGHTIQWQLRTVTTNRPEVSTDPTSIPEITRAKLTSQPWGCLLTGFTHPFLLKKWLFLSFKSRVEQSFWKQRGALVYSNGWPPFLLASTDWPCLDKDLNNRETADGKKAVNNCSGTDK